VEKSATPSHAEEPSSTVDSATRHTPIARS
jgi:hypothetical protein